nr:sugar ABC transporter permease [uncultured Niameybacter sp.]
MQIQLKEKTSIVSKSRFRDSKGFFLGVCIIPTFILYAIFMLYPIINLIRVSFYSWDGLLGDMEWVGLGNYKTMFQNQLFWDGFKNTCILIVVPTLFTIILALFFAAVLAKNNMKGKSFFRVVFYFPNILSVVVISGIFNGIYSPDKGILNSILDMFSLSGWKHNWLADSNVVLYALAAAMIWQAVGYYMVMYVAGMDSIPDSLYEVADLESATGFQKFWYITMPMTWEVIRVTLTFFIISNINLSFLFVKAMTQGGPDGASEVLLNIMYQQAYSAGNYGYGMAVGSFLFIFSFGLSLIVQRLTNKEETIGGESK